MVFDGRICLVEKEAATGFVKCSVRVVSLVTYGGEWNDRISEEPIMTTTNGVDVPEELADALKSRAILRDTFERMSAACQREYVQWIDEAKRTETRLKRVEGTLTGIAEWGERHP